MAVTLGRQGNGFLQALLHVEIQLLHPPDDVEAELPKVLNALVSIERDGFEQVGRKRAPWSDATTGKSRELIETFVENRLFVTELADDFNTSTALSVNHCRLTRDV